MNILLTLILVFAIIRTIKFWYEVNKPSPEIFAHIVKMRVQEFNHKIHIYLVRKHKQFQAEISRRKRAKNQCPVFTYKYGQPSFFDARQCRDYKQQPTWGCYKEKDNQN